MAAATPFELLQDLARRSRDNAEGLPAQEEAVSLWSGIGFTLAGEHYVAPMGEVVEILHVPRFTQVPGVRHFMLGVANVRGRLLPVVDLADFFGLPHGKRSLRERRILVIEHGELFSGLVVDAVLGMQYFAVDSFTPTPGKDNEAIRPFLQGAYHRGEETWKVFSTVELSEDEAFLDIAQW
ncbi:MAG: chemotaxis protein CheW [Oleiphilaceae bacterium]|nr:chemotaxis protein CheW [Oleiphilaceae bacterium]